MWLTMLIYFVCLSSISNEPVSSILKHFCVTSFTTQIKIMIVICGETVKSRVGTKKSPILNAGRTASFILMLLSSS